MNSLSLIHKELFQHKIGRVCTVQDDFVFEKAEIRKTFAEVDENKLIFVQKDEADIINFSVLWAKAMQIEMRQKNKDLDQEIILSTLNNAALASDGKKVFEYSNSAIFL